MIVALGGDGLMLSTLHATEGGASGLRHEPRHGRLPDERHIAEERLPDRLAAAEAAVINPLRMRATRADGDVVEALAINEVSILRAGPQAAKLRILVDGRERLAELVADGALLCTPAGSTAYNYSAHGPILPIGADVLALTPMAAFRPRRWRGALLPKTARVAFEVLEPGSARSRRWPTRPRCATRSASRSGACRTSRTTSSSTRATASRSG